MSREEFFRSYNQKPQRKKYNCQLQQKLRKQAREIRKKEENKFQSFTLYELGDNNKLLLLPSCGEKLSLKFNRRKRLKPCCRKSTCPRILYLKEEIRNG